MSDRTIAHNTAITARDVLRLPSPYSVDECIRRWPARLYSRRHVILPTGSTIMELVGRLERDKALAGWRRRWKHWAKGARWTITLIAIL